MRYDWEMDFNFFLYSSLVVVIKNHTQGDFSGTQTTHIDASVWFVTVVEWVSKNSWKRSRAATINEVHPASGKSKTPCILACVDSYSEW